MQRREGVDHLLGDGSRTFCAQRLELRGATVRCAVGLGHDVERSAEDVGILAVGEHLRHRHIGLSKADMTVYSRPMSCAVAST